MNRPSPGAIAVGVGLVVVAAGVVIAVNAWRSAPDQSAQAQIQEAVNANPPKPPPSAPARASRRIRTGLARAAYVARESEAGRPVDPGKVANVKAGKLGEAITDDGAPTELGIVAWARGTASLLWRRVTS